MTSTAAVISQRCGAIVRRLWPQALAWMGTQDGRKPARLFAFVTIALVSILVSLPMILAGAPTGGDSDFHIRWISYFTEQFWQGGAYPRWLNDDYRGYGSPVFYFYPPLGYIVAAFLPPPPLHLPADARLVMALILVRALAGLACYLWLAQVVGRRAALASAVLYVVAPYHLTVDLYVRTSYSELWSFVWLPLMLYWCERIRVAARPAIAGLALSYAGLIMSTLPGAVIAALVPFVYLLLRHGWSMKPQLRVLAGAGLGVALAGAALVPALALMDEVMSSALITAQRPLAQSFVGLHLLLEEPAKGGVTLINLGLLGLVLASLWLFRDGFARDGIDRWLLAVGAVAVIAAFMVTPLSEPLWRILSPLPYVQFPWRFNVILELCLAALVPATLFRLLAGDGKRRGPSRFLAVLLGAGLLGWFAIDAFGLYRYAPDGPTGRARLARAASEISDPRNLPLEWLPRSSAGAVSALVADSGPKEPVVTAGRGRIGPVEETAARARFHIRAESEVRVVYPRFFFPSVGVRRDGEAVQDVAPSTGLGLVTFTLPPGDHEVELVLRTLPEEWLGLAISIAGLTALAFMLICPIGGAGPPRRARDLSGQDGLDQDEPAMSTLSQVAAATALLAATLVAACGPAVDEPAGDAAEDAAEPAASTAVADARPAETFQCLQGADVIAAPQGPQATDSWIVRPAPGEAVDLRGATYTAHSRNAVRLRGSDAGICAVGGTIVGDWDHCASWRELKDENHACLSFETNQTSIHGLHCFNVHDGIRPRSPDGPRSVPAGGEDFDIAHVWLEYIRDDCIENDTVASGTIRDSLLDGCFAGVSVRPGKQRPDLTDVTVTLDRVLMRLEPMPHPNRSVITTVDGIDYGHLAILKTYRGGPSWVIKDSIFAIHGDSHSDLTQGFDQLKACSNNTIVWLGEGPFPAWYPEDCFTVTTDVSVWQEAVADWHARHPEVGKTRKPKPELMGSVALDCRARDRSG